MTRQNNPQQGQGQVQASSSSRPSFSTQTYRIYCQAKGQASFHALDLSTGEQVRNLIQATLIPAKDIVPLIAKLTAWNPGWKFHARPAGRKGGQQNEA